METKQAVGMVIALTVAVIIVSSLLVPVITAARGDVVIVEQEGAGWLRFAQIGDNSDYSVQYMISGENVTIGTQTGTADDMIVYADSINTTVLLDGSFYNTDTNGVRELSDGFTISRSGGNVTIDGESAGSPTYAYVPMTQGSYGFFDGSTPAITEGPLISFGSFAGLTVSDKYTPYGLVMENTYEDEYLESVRWAKGVGESAQAVKAVGAITESAPMLLSVPTPSYTDGDWGYDIDPWSRLTIVAYSGPGGNIVIPDTLNNTDVICLGNSGLSSSVFGELEVTSLTIPSGVTRIQSGFLYESVNAVCPIVIPDTVNFIGQATFAGSGITGLIIPSSVQYLNSSIVDRCNNLTNLVICSDATPQSNTYSNSGIKKVLDLSNKEYTTTSYGLNADEVRSDIPGAGYLAPAEFREGSVKEGAVWSILAVVPLVVLTGIVYMAAQWIRKE